MSCLRGLMDLKIFVFLILLFINASWLNFRKIFYWICENWIYVVDDVLTSDGGRRGLGGKKKTWKNSLKHNWIHFAKLLSPLIPFNSFKSQLSRDFLFNFSQKLSIFKHFPNFQIPSVSASQRQPLAFRDIHTNSIRTFNPIYVHKI